MNADDVKYKIEVMQAYLEGKQIQVKELHEEDWEDMKAPTFSSWGMLQYRVKPEIIEKPSINWNHVSDKFNYFALDRKGNVESAWVYTDKPSWGFVTWEGYNATMTNAFKSLNPGNCEPQDSLICRPGFE